MESKLITKAGRSFWTSAPAEGSKLTSQISPRLIADVGGVAMEFFFLGKCVEPG